MRVILATIMLCLALVSSAEAQSAAPSGNRDLAGTVRDSANTEPLQGVEIDATRDHQLVARANTDQFGRYIIHDLPAGTYIIQVRLIGYRLASRTISVGQGTQATSESFALAIAPLMVQG